MVTEVGHLDIMEFVNNEPIINKFLRQNYIGREYPNLLFVPGFRGFLSLKHFSQLTRVLNYQIQYSVQNTL